MKFGKCFCLSAYRPLIIFKIYFKVLPHKYISRVIKDFLVTHRDENQIEISYSFKPGVNLYSYLHTITETSPQGEFCSSLHAHLLGCFKTIDLKGCMMASLMQTISLAISNLMAILSVLPSLYYETS